MKIWACFVISVLTIQCEAANPFNRGVNLTNWFQAGSAHQIQFTKFTKQDLINIKSLGCDVVRLPINLHAMTDGKPDYNIEPLFFDFLDQVVDWSEDLQLNLILDNHTFDPAANTDPNIGGVLVKVWKQMAEHYKNRSTLIYYEVLNEPHGITNQAWNQIQQTVIDAIRSADQKHTIVVGAANWNTYNDLKNLPVYTDNNLIYTFHFYDPFVFTHQGASWTDPSMVPLSGVPFPYDASRMPQVPVSLEGSWIGSAMNNYMNDGTVAHVKSLIDIAVQFKNDRHVPVYCGEFGVYIPNSANEDRVFWYETIRKYLEENGIAWTTWDYKGGFGLFKKGSNEMFDYDLNVPLVQALGLTASAQKEYIQKPDSIPFNIYTDCIGENISDASYATNGNLDYYCDKPFADKYCIQWTGVDQYSTIGFDFKPNKDLSRLKNANYAVDFWVRSDSPGTKFDIRFVDTKTADANDHPWRMRFIIDDNMVPWDSRWHHVHLLLKDFQEHGAWDNGWFEPLGLFDWNAIDGFEIVAEHQSLVGRQLWFDNIKVTNVAPNDIVTATDLDPGNQMDKGFLIFPNPFCGSTSIRIQLSEYGPAEICIFDLSGKKIYTLKRELGSINHDLIKWGGVDDHGLAVSPGLYLCRLMTPTFQATRKIVFKGD